LLIATALAVPVSADSYNPAAHTDPINLTPALREAHEHFYTLDFDGALARFEAIQRDHPQSAIVTGYMLMTLIFRELYRQDLLDTTYYAHDSFLTSKRNVPVPQDVRDRIESLTNSAVALCDQQIKSNPNDANAYFARGYARGMHAAFITLVDHSFVAAARQGLASRNDSEATLRIDPGYADAKMAIGIQQFAVASLPRLVRMLVGIAGVGGNKEKGLALLRESAAHGIVTPVESRTALSFFATMPATPKPSSSRRAWPTNILTTTSSASKSPTSPRTPATVPAPSPSTAPSSPTRKSPATSSSLAFT
jgi:hypothetical protein